jgi:hypothetical protein
MGTGEASGASEILDPQWLEVPRVSEILRTQEVAGSWNENQARSGYPAQTCAETDIQAAREELERAAGVE